MKNCKQCNDSFQIAEEDKAFYEKVSPTFNGKKYLVPEPELCPPCREQIRAGWKNEMNLYKYQCDKCQDETMSIYSKDKPYTVYCIKCWWGDEWDPLAYGMDYDFNRPFFEQFNELINKVPKQALEHNKNENCDYTTSTTMNRNCYLISSSGKNEDCYYGFLLKSNKNCVDNTHIMESELCYECVDGNGGYNLKYSQNTSECIDSNFLYDCRNSQHCFFSYGLRNKKYVFRNEQLTKEEYEKKIAKIDFTSYEVIERLKQEFQVFCQDYPHLYFDGKNNENVDHSNYIFNSKNCSFCFDAYGLEDCKFCSWYNESKDSYDIYAFGYGSELCYNCLAIGTNAQNLLFCIHTYNAVTDILYSMYCHSSSNLLGCAGLRHKKYCILNKQYTKEEYEKLVSRIIESMQKNGEWGEFLPVEFSLFAYNESMGQFYFPMKKEEVLARGWKWKDETEEIPEVDKIIPAERLPDNLKDIPDDILNWAIRCQRTKKPYRILKNELKFYRKHDIPVPHLHPNERNKDRLALRNPRKFFEKKCDKCGVKIITSYAPDRPEKVYCDKCYLESVY